MSIAFAINTTFIICAALILLLGILGYVRGIIGVIFSLFSWVITFALLFFLEPVFEEALRNTSLYDAVLTYIKSRADVKLSTEFGGLLSSDTQIIGDALIKVTDIVFHAVAQLICVVFSILLMIIIRTIIAIINKAPVVGTASHIFGMLFGVASAYLILCVVFMISGKLFMTAFGEMVLSDVEENIVLTYLYNYNPLLKIFN